MRLAVAAGVSVNAHVHQAHAYPAAWQRPGLPDGWHVRYPLAPGSGAQRRAADRSDTRSVIPGTERGNSRPRARLVSDVSGSLQVCLGISAYEAHLILMSQV